MVKRFGVASEGREMLLDTNNNRYICCAPDNTPELKNTSKQINSR